MAFEQYVDTVDQVLISRTQTIRSQILDELMKDGKVPETKDDRALLLETMKDIDKSIYTKARVKLADKAGEDSKDVAKILAEALSRHTAGTTGVRKAMPQLGSDVTVTDMVDGEDLIGVQNVDYDQFMVDR